MRLFNILLTVAFVVIAYTYAVGPSPGMPNRSLTGFLMVCYCIAAAHAKFAALTWHRFSHPAEFKNLFDRMDDRLRGPDEWL